MEKIENLIIKNKITVSFIAAVLLWLFVASVSHAATITVSSGNDGLSADANCTLSEAITNINNGNATTYTECTGTGVFGTNDTINLPNGTITLTADLPQITESINIQGQGMDVSIIDGDSAFKVFESAAGAGSSTVASGFTVQAYAGVGLVSNSSNVDFNEIEIDGSNAIAGSANVSIGFFNNASGNYNATIKNVYVHDITNMPYNTNVVGIWVVVGYGADIEVNIENVTVENVVAQGTSESAQGIGILNGAFQGGDYAQLTTTLRNATINNISSTDGSSIGIASTTFSDRALSANQTTTRIINSTIKDVVAASGTAMVAGGVGSTVAGFTSGGVQVGAILELTNNIITNTSSACVVTDLSSLFGVTDATASNTVTSGGGNIVDDNNCASYLTQTTDQNNIVGLASTLGTLANNGGFVPTIALLANSPAVDGGVTVSGLTADARSAVRPQGLAFDSGAYESPFVRAASNADSEQASLADTGSSLLGIFTLGGALTASGIGFLLVSRKHLV